MKTDPKKPMWKICSAPICFEALVKESYADALKGVTLDINPNIPRLAKRFEAASQSAGLSLGKAGPARLLMAKLGEDPNLLDEDTTGRFERLFSRINAAFEDLKQ